MTTQKAQQRKAKTARPEKVAVDPSKNKVVVKCHADNSWLSEFGDENKGDIFRLERSRRLVTTADDPRLEHYFNAPYEVRDITVTPDVSPTPTPTTSVQDDEVEFSDEDRAELAAELAEALTEKRELLALLKEVAAMHQYAGTPESYWSGSEVELAKKVNAAIKRLDTEVAQ